jgi:putative ABC transport system permease protein
MDARQDLRFAVRTLRRSPGWLAGVVLTLALGIGLSTAVFTIAESLLIQPLPVRAQDRIAVLWGITRDGRTDHFPLLYRDAIEYARRAQTLERVEFFAYGGAQQVPIRTDAGMLRLRRSLVSGGFFELLGTRPLLGRALRPDDDVKGATPVAVLSYSAWRRFFGGAPDVLGRRLVLHSNDTPYTIVGVMPLGLDYPQGVDFWTPVVPNSGPLGDQPIYAELNVIGRLRSGATVAEAEAELTRFFASTKAAAWGVRGVAHSFMSDVVGDAGRAVVAFAAAAMLLLLITCINVANLLLIRGLTRTREIAVRAALGASRGRIVAHLLLESALLALAGGLIGALFASAAIRGFVVLAPAGTPRLDEIRVTGRVIAAAIGITSLATLLFAIAPSLVSSRVRFQDALRAGTRQTGGSRGMRFASQALVVGQMTLAIVVLSAAGLLTRSLIALERVDVAFDPERLAVAELALPPSYMNDAPKQIAMLDGVLRRVAAMPGVRSVAPVLTPPLASVGGIFGRLPAEGQSAADIARNPALTFELATPSYFSTLGIRLVGGRLFNDGDDKRAPPVAIISEAAARHYWPNENAIGKRLVRGKDEFVTVVGVARDTHYRDLRNPRPTIYFPLEQSIFSAFVPTTLIIETDARDANVAPMLRRTIADAVPGVALAGVVPFEAFVAGTLAQPRLNALLLAIFAGAALSLAAIGLFSVMATTVRQRTRELAVRVALGATPSDLRHAVLLQGLSLASLGAVLGVMISLATTRALESLLFQFSPTDAPTLIAVCGALLGVATVATLLPARRAERVDPMLALRSD